LRRKNYRFFMYPQMPLLIIRQLQPPYNSRTANCWEIILEYRKHEALNDYIEQDKINLCPEKEGGVITLRFLSITDYTNYPD